MADRYHAFADLGASEIEGIHYRICVTNRTSPVAIVAPHGGEIEPGTSQIAAAIAGDTFSLYCFEGLIPGRPHGDLHIRSERFDEPKGLRLVEASQLAVGVHGRKNGDDRLAVWVGGLDKRLRDAVSAALVFDGFSAKTTGHDLPGKAPTNICNRGRRKAGVQLEIPRTLRDKLVAEPQQRQAFAAAVRQAIDRRISDVD